MCLKKNELEQLIQQCGNLVIESSYYDEDNWVVLVEKIEK